MSEGGKEILLKIVVQISITNCNMKDINLNCARIWEELSVNFGEKHPQIRKEAFNG